MRFWISDMKSNLIIPSIQSDSMISPHRTLNVSAGLETLPDVEVS